MFCRRHLIAVSWDVLHVIRESVTHPLQHLIIAVRRMGDGNYSVPLETLDRSALSGLTNEMEMARRKTSAQIEELKSKNAELTVDITERIEKLGSAALDLLEANEIKDRFLGMAAHDLRNPINAVRMMSEMLSTVDVDDEPRRDFYKNMHRSAMQMLSLINDLLDVSAIESGTLQMRPITANLKKEIQDRVRMQQMTADNKKIVISIDEKDIPDSEFDTDRIGQVVDKLISNALKFSPPGTGIHVHLIFDQNNVGFTVEDEGPGIPANELSHLFEEFVKLSNRPTAGESSTGLGLSIVKKIVESHHGSIDVDSKVGRGTRFTVSIPMEMTASGNSDET